MSRQEKPYKAYCYINKNWMPCHTQRLEHLEKCWMNCILNNSRCMHPETGAFLQFVHIDLKEYFMLNLNKQKDNRDCWKITARRFLRSRMNQMAGGEYHAICQKIEKR